MAPIWCRSTARIGLEPGFRAYQTGFRVVRDEVLSSRVVTEVDAGPAELVGAIGKIASESKHVMIPQEFGDWVKSYHKEFWSANAREVESITDVKAQIHGSPNEYIGSRLSSPGRGEFEKEADYELRVAALATKVRLAEERIATKMIEIGSLGGNVLLCKLPVDRMKGVWKEGRVSDLSEHPYNPERQRFTKLYFRVDPRCVPCTKMRDSHGLFGVKQEPFHLLPLDAPRESHLLGYHGLRHPLMQSFNYAFSAPEASEEPSFGHTDKLFETPYWAHFDLYEVNVPIERAKTFAQDLKENKYRGGVVLNWYGYVVPYNTDPIIKKMNIPLELFLLQRRVLIYHITTGEIVFDAEYKNYTVRGTSPRLFETKSAGTGGSVSDKASDGVKSRVWTDIRGRKLDAEFLALVGANVKLKRQDNGDVVYVPLSTLSRDDQNYVRQVKYAPHVAFLSHRSTRLRLRLRVKRGALALPISHAAVAVEHPLQDFLLERMLLHFGFVDLDAQARPRVGADDAAARSRR